MLSVAFFLLLLLRLRLLRFLLLRRNYSLSLDVTKRFKRLDSFLLENTVLRGRLERDILIYDRKYQSGDRPRILRLTVYTGVLISSARFDRHFQLVLLY